MQRHWSSLCLVGVKGYKGVVLVFFQGKGVKVYKVAVLVFFQGKGCKGYKGI